MGDDDDDDDEDEGGWFGFGRFGQSEPSSQCSTPRSSSSSSTDQTPLERAAQHGISLVQSGVRDVRHRLASAALALHEGPGQKVRGLVEGIVAEDAELKSRAEAMGVGESEAPERWWHSACQDAHCAHRLEDDPPQLEPDCFGWLEAEFLSVEPTPPLVREDGEEALAPVCQLSLAGRNTGLLRPTDASTEGSFGVEGERPQGSVARFTIEEVAGTDLRVNIFDCGSTQFKMGFEDQAFCGGAFVPLTAILKYGSGSPSVLGVPTGTSFETRFQLGLLPLRMLRARRKLEPAETSNAKQPEQPLGSVHLRLLLTLREQPATLLTRAPVMVAGAPAAQPLIGDAAGVMSAAGTAASRAGRTFTFDILMSVFDELREELAPAAALYAWWSVMLLAAPLWLWPLLLPAILPLISWKYAPATRLASSSQPLRLYADEVPLPPTPQLTTSGHVQKAVKDAVHAQLSLMQLVESCNKWVGQVEKMKLVVAIADPAYSFVFGMLLLATAASISATLWACAVVGNGGTRLIVWATGGCFLLPKRGRDAVMEFLDWTGMLEGNSLSCFWGRAHDAFEARHRCLVERYVVIGSRRGAPPRPESPQAASG